MKKVAILQSNYIPWKGYFDLIASVDEFILYDDMQYTRRDWRNRNQIKTPEGVQWLTVPVKVKGKYEQKIKETEIDGEKWAGDHWKALRQNYAKSTCFKEICALLEPLYLGVKYPTISSLNKSFLTAICGYLGITTKFSDSSDYQLVEGKTERLVDLCLQAGASEYISGPSAKGYVDEQLFTANQVALKWFSYDSYPAYPQQWGEFVHSVSIVDLLFNCGKESARYMKYVKP